MVCAGDEIYCISDKGVFSKEIVLKAAWLLLD